MLMAESHLVEFYGTECVHCIEMKPLVEKMEKELKVKVTGKECWHNEKNQAEFLKVAEGKCPGVPFFLNTKSGKFICGAASFEKLKEWAEGK